MSHRTLRRTALGLLAVMTAVGIGGPFTVYSD
jgi:hypothetical protein